MRRIIVGLAAAALSALTVAQSQAEDKKVSFAIAQTTISPIAINFVVPAYLGYYKQEGIDFEIAPVGTNAAVLAALDQERTNYAVGVPTFQLPLIAKGEKLDLINYFQYLYPFKWAIAVKPESEVQSLKDLAGKTVGVTGFGLAEYKIGQQLMRLAGMDPEKDVEWLAVGEGPAGASALNDGTIAALVNFDTVFGRMEADGVAMRYLPLPENKPEVGGLYIAAKPEYLASHREEAVGFARAVAKGALFVQQNPEAAAYIFLQLYPEAAPRAASVEEQVKALMVPIVKRMPLFSPYDKTATVVGQMTTSAWQQEAEFLGLQDQIKDVSPIFTNDLIQEINNFDKDAVIQDAKNFKLPYKKG